MENIKKQNKAHNKKSADNVDNRENLKEKIYEEPVEKKFNGSKNPMDFEHKLKTFKNHLKNKARGQNER